MNSAIIGLGGLIAGVAIGFLYARLTSAGHDALLAQSTAALHERDAQLLVAQGSIQALEGRIAAMQSNQTETTRLATELAAMKKSVETLSTQAQNAELGRVAAEQQIRNDLTNMATTNKSLLDETAKIAGALSNSQSRGKFGEAQLEQLLESAGLVEGVHFTRQQHMTGGDDKVGIPDITISFPGSSVLFIDSKFPFERFLDAFETDDPVQRENLMQAHAKDLLKHVDALAKRGYANQNNSASFVVLFAPFESILTEALRVDSQLLKNAFRKKVTIATPTTMMALLSTVGNVFSRNQLAENAAEIQELAGTFLKNVAALHTKIVAVGERLKSTVKAYNEMIPTAESTVLRPAIKIINLGVSGTNPKAFPELTDSVRSLRTREAIDGPGDFIDAEDISGEEEGSR